MAILSPAETHVKSPDVAVKNAKSAAIGTTANQDLDSVLTAVDSTIAANLSSTTTSLSTEAATRAAADTTLQNNINSEATTRAAADTAEATTRASAITSEANTRATADTLLQTEIDGERSPLRMTVTGSSKIVTLASAVTTRTDSLGNTSSIGIQNGSILSDFGGATIDFSNGTIIYTNGNQANGSFSLISFSGNNSKWAKYSIALLPTVPNTLAITAGSSFGNTASLASAPALAVGVSVGVVSVQDNGSGGTGTINNILQSSLIQLFADSGNTHNGSSPLDPDPNDTFVYYTRSDFSIDGSTFLSSTTGTNLILGSQKITLNIGNQFISTDLTGQQIRDDGLSITQAQARLMYNTGKVDYSPTIEFSRDGGASYTSSTVSVPTSDGNFILGDITWASSSNALYDGGTASGSSLTASRVASIFSPSYRTLITSFSAYVSSSSGSGTIAGKIYSVSGGVPQSVLATCVESYVAGTDITSTAGYKTFTLSSPITLTAGTNYALAVEGTGATLSFGTVVASIPSFSQGAATYVGSWGSSTSKLAYKVFGTGCDLRLRITSSTTASELIGFGVNYVSNNTTLGLSGTASYEDRFITSTEASTGLITLARCRYTPGMHQLSCNYNNHIYQAPDFTETSSSSVTFPANFFATGDYVRFYTGFGLVDGTSQSLTKFATIYDAIVGTASQYATGVATYQTIQSAVNGVQPGGKILVLKGTYTENVSVSQEVHIEGSGHSCVINGTMTYQSGATGSSTKWIYFGGNITINSSANNMIIMSNWIMNGITLTNNGTNNLILNLGE